MKLILLQRNYPEKGSYSINQTQLLKQLNLSPRIIKYLRDTNVLEWKTVDRKIMFDTYSVDRFTLTFKREDFLNTKECKHILNKWGFYSDYERGVYVNKIGIYISVKSLINRCADIPNEYFPISVKFDTSTFISKVSFSNTLRWLNNEYKRLHPKTPKGYVMRRTTKGGCRVNPFARKKPKFKKK